MIKNVSKYNFKLYLMISVLAVSCVNILLMIFFKKDLPEEMPADFDFILNYGMGGRNKIDTFNNIVQKDLVMDGLASGTLELSRDEKKVVYNRLKAINILKFPGTIRHFSLRQEYLITFSYFKFRYNGKIKEISFYDNFSEKNIGVNNLREALWDIENMIKEHKEYKALPEAKGGYL